MRRIESLLVGLALLALLLLADSSPVPAQDAAKVNPRAVTVKVDNDRVRVLDAVLPPGEKENLHSHPACVVYVVSGGNARVHYADGKVVDAILTPGEVIYRGPVTHGAENVGETPIHVVTVELKTPSE